MSLRKGMDEDPWDQTGMNTEIEVIYTCLNDIARQVTDLNKYVETLFGEVYEEIYKVSCKFMVLQKNVTQLSDAITAKYLKVLTMQVRESGNTFPTATRQTQQVCSFNSTPLKTLEHYSDEVDISSVTMCDSYYLDETKGFSSSDGSFQLCSSCPELWEEKKRAKKKGHRMEMFVQNKKDIGHSNDSKCIPKLQPMGNNSSAAHGKIFHSYINRPSKKSSSPMFECSTISIILARAIGKVLSSALYPEHDATEDRENSCAYDSYGTGKSEAKPQPQNHHQKAEVFLNPKAAALSSPPQLNWSAGLKASKSSEIPATIPAPTNLSLPVWIHTATSRATQTTETESDCLQSTPDTDIPVTPPKAALCHIAPEPVKYSEMNPDDQNLQDKTMTSHVFPYPVTDHANFALPGEPQLSSSFQSALCSVSQSPLLVNSAISSFPSKLQSSYPSLSQNLILSTSESLLEPQPRSSTSQRTNSVPMSSISSCSQSISEIPLPKQVPSPFSGYFNEQLASAPAANSTRNSNSQPPRPSEFELSEYSFLQSLFSFQSTPTISRSTKRRSRFWYSPKVSSALKYSPPSTVPILSITRSDFMEAVKKGTVLNKPEDPCRKEATVKLLDNERSIILNRRKAMGYSSEISDSESDCIEEK